MGCCDKKRASWKRKVETKKDKVDIFSMPDTLLTPKQKRIKARHLRILARQARILARQAKQNQITQQNNIPPIV